MLKRLLLAVLATAFFAAVTLPSFTIAQTTTTEDTKTKKKATKKKEKKDDATSEAKAEPKKKKAPTAKQLAARQKFSNCAKSWGDHKKTSGEKGQKAYRAYMSKCLKKDG
jgi:Ni/Co efflux regulator RcnB